MLNQKRREKKMHWLQTMYAHGKAGGDEPAKEGAELEDDDEVTTVRSMLSCTLVLRGCLLTANR